MVSALTRGSRFFLISFLIGNFGTTMKKINRKKITKSFNNNIYYFNFICSIYLLFFKNFI